MKLVVGLGNPGRKYAGTRHNVGFDVVDLLAGRAGISMARERFSGLTGDGLVEEQRVVLLKPMTYMNLSGRSVRETMTFYKVELADVLVVVDDLALPVGRLRMRARGSAGGHNGLTSVIAEAGGDGFSRLRIGIGASRPGGMVDHVLSPFSREEAATMAAAVERAADAVRCWLREGVEAAMNRFNKADDETGD